MTCLSAGESQAIVVSQGEHTALIDCGKHDSRNAADTVCEYLDWWGYDRIDTLVLTALDEKHAGGVSALADCIPIDEVYLPDAAGKQAEAIKARFASYCRTVSDSDEPVSLGDDSLHLSAIPVDTCLAVRLTPAADTIWIAHSLTPRQLTALTKEQPMHSTALVLSASYFDEDAIPAETELTSKQIILESSWKTAEEWEGIPVTSLKQTGSYTLTYTHP